MRRYDRPEDEWVGIPFPTIVDGDTWELAQQAKRRRLTRSRRNTKIFYLLQHLVRCAECGHVMGCRSTRRESTSDAAVRSTATNWNAPGATTAATGCTDRGSEVPGASLHQGRPSRRDWSGAR